MARPTVIRSKAIGNKLGTVVTVLNPFSVWFQIYLVLSKGRSEGGPFVMVDEAEFETELDAVARFAGWVEEAEIEEGIK